MAFDKRKALQNALAYTQQGRWDRAIAEYQSILKADPRDVTVCNNLGDLFARAGKTADAIDQYLKLGELYRADGLSVKAIAVYKKIAKLDPARTEAHLACADLYWEQGLVGEAKIQMATVVEHFSRAGETQKLIDAYKRLSQFDPTNAAVLTRLADLMVREGMREPAAAEYERRGHRLLHRLMWVFLLAGIGAAGVALFAFGAAQWIESRLGVPGSGAMIVGMGLMVIFLAIALARAERKEENP